MTTNLNGANNASRRFLSVTEFATISGYNPGYVRTLIRQGKLKSYKFENCRRIEVKQSLEFIKTRNNNIHKKVSKKAMVVDLKGMLKINNTFKKTPSSFLLPA